MKYPYHFIPHWPLVSTARPTHHWTNALRITHGSGDPPLRLLDGLSAPPDRSASHRPLSRLFRRLAGAARGAAPRSRRRLESASPATPCSSSVTRDSATTTRWWRTPAPRRARAALLSASIPGISRSSPSTTPTWTRSGSRGSSRFSGSGTASTAHRRRPASPPRRSFRRLLAAHLFARCGATSSASSSPSSPTATTWRSVTTVVHRHVLLDDRGGITLGTG